MAKNGRAGGVHSIACNSRSLTSTSATTMWHSSSSRSGAAILTASGSAEEPRAVGVERADAVVVRQAVQSRVDRVALGEIVRIAEVAPLVLLAQLFETCLETGALAARDDDLREGQAAPQLGTRRIDDGARKDRLCRLTT